MKALKFLLKKEFLQILRNRFLLAIIVLIPVFELAVLPWAATFEQKNISLCIVDGDHSSYSRRLIEKILSSGYFKLTSHEPDYDHALRRIETGHANLILIIPPAFEKDYVNRQPLKMMLVIDAVDGQKAGLGMSYLSQIILAYNTQIEVEAGNRTGAFINIKPHYRYNDAMRYQNYMVPGILVILVTMMGGMLSALNIVREKEIGTIEQMNVTPVSKSMFILGKLIPFWLLGLINLTIGIFIGWLIYGLFPVGNILNIYLFAFFYLLAFTGFGLMISNFAQTQQQAMLVLIFFLIIFILLSGLFTPISSMPEWAQRVTIFNPVRYFVEIVRLVYMKGSGIHDILPQLYRIFGFIVVFNFLAIVSYRKTQG
ncbi:MAG TPA: ABC transporter permease [Porphyromonadaceae bacterium]|jgi:ABC-2 type transport system permease protein|uniref:ABC transporter permease n=1 Tax=Limibacterium fermenti TaxID=3229863 RepID=UPI000E90D245|nr:ABC transporter permease [Porphyromonadaceae bacterium]HBL34964.1 ABC transporter permease [Porphyromonadaceae bacterium]HBX45328.1 ABC transporter permease [Porphyromonadaceae bacterium]